MKIKIPYSNTLIRPMYEINLIQSVNIGERASRSPDISHAVLLFAAYDQMNVVLFIMTFLGTVFL